MNTPQWLEMQDILAIIVRLLLTSVCSGILGYEREKRNQAAGFRTYILVSNASALVMMTNAFIFRATGAGDPVRMGAQVISGIGFLGAGAILVTRSRRVRGLTTAAGLWSSAIIGMALGAGYYTAALACSLFTYITLKFLSTIDLHINRHPYMMTFYCEIDARRNLTDLIRYAQEKGYRIRDIETTSLTADSFGPSQITLSIYTDGKVDAETLLTELEHVDGVRFIAPI